MIFSGETKAYRTVQLFGVKAIVVETVRGDQKGAGLCIG